MERRASNVGAEIWYICCPAYERSVSNDGYFRCTEVLLIQAASEAEAAQKALQDTDEDWHIVLVVQAEEFFAQ